MGRMAKQSMKNAHFYGPDGILHWKNASFYGPDGILHWKNAYFYGPDGILHWKKAYCYGPDGIFLVKNDIFLWAGWQNSLGKILIS